jgi:hypothetical protein
MPLDGASAKTYPGALLGFRAWYVDDDELCSLIFREPWPAGVPARAHCLEGHDCSAPEPNCLCGLYAYHDLAQALRLGAALSFAGLAVVGSVAGRGRVLIHRDGFRAEEAQTLALLRPQHISAASAVIERLARDRSLPLFEHPLELALHGAALAQPAPPSLVPLVSEEACP